MDSIATRKGLSYVYVYFVTQSNSFNSLCFILKNGYHGDVLVNEIKSLMEALMCLGSAT